MQKNVLSIVSAPGRAELLNERLVDLLLRQIPSGVLVLKAPGGDPVLANPQMFSILRVPEEKMEEFEWVGFHPDGRRYRPNEWPHARALAGVAVAAPEEVEIVRHDGTRTTVRMTAVPLLHEPGGISAVLVNCLDVSEGRRSSTSRKFLTEASRLLASSVDHVTTLQNLARLAVPTLADWCTIDLLDDEGMLERVAVEHIDQRKAKAATELARRHPPAIADVGVGRAVRDSTSELIPEVTPAILDRVAQNPGHRKLLEELGIRSVMFVPLIARGRTLGAIGFVSAESNRRYAEEDLEVAEELAARAGLAIDNSRLFRESRAADEAKSDFLAIMSHELRTPLTAIIGYAELLQLGVPDPVTPKQHEQAERIEVSARHLLQLIEEILTLVSLDSGEDRIRSREISANAVVQRAAAIVEPMARAKGIDLQVLPAPDDPQLESDPEKIVQVLLNLLSNAVKFTDEGSIRAVVRVEGSECVFEVTDTGIGMDAAHLRRIYEPFWQVERPITRKAGGTGLGLTITRRLTDMLQGRLMVRSEPGRGSTFEVYIPLRLPTGRAGAGTSSA